MLLLYIAFVSLRSREKKTNCLVLLLWLLSITFQCCNFSVVAGFIVLLQQSRGQWPVVITEKLSKLAVMMLSSLSAASVAYARAISSVRTALARAIETLIYFRQQQKITCSILEN